MRVLDEMMNKKAELQIAPLIDVVFLLLIYFMVTTALKAKEADLSFMLPAKVETSEPVNEPWEVVIEITDQGEVFANGMQFGQGGTSLEGLTTQLLTEKQGAEASQSDFIVNILPDDKTLHGRIIQVMDACAGAKVKNLSFSTTTM